MTVSGIRRRLLLVSGFAVLGDAVLMPFYPQFFASRFGVVAPEAVGAYLAAMCLVVMLALPAWARLGGAAPMRLLVWTQGGAGLLCLVCAFVPSLIVFWVASLGMFALKASYLLVYPYMLRLEGKDRHADTIGTLTVIVRLGTIAGALIGGVLLQTSAAGWAFIAMALTDFAQMAICVLLRNSPAGAEHAHAGDHTAAPAPVMRLCLAMVIFYFGAFLVRPFFALYWIAVSGLGSVALSGIVYALPAVAALVALAANRRRCIEAMHLRQSFGAMVALGTVGLLLQALPSIPLILLGRCLFGWSLFQVSVALDAFLFDVSSPPRFAIDFSKANIAQNLGVIASSLVAGACVAISPALPFLVAAAAVGLTPLALPRSSAAALPASLKETTL
jgi:DHA1 family multidrug resistance protein-like MFS transporter